MTGALVMDMRAHPVLFAFPPLLFQVGDIMGAFVMVMRAHPRDADVAGMYVCISVCTCVCVCVFVCVCVRVRVREIGRAHV